MNSHTRLFPVQTIPVEAIRAVIAAANRLLANNERDGVAHLGLLCAVDTLDGHGALEDRIVEQESDLGLGDGDEPECLACGGSDCLCDSLHDELSLVAYDRISPTAIAL